MVTRIYGQDAARPLFESKFCEVQIAVRSSTRTSTTRILNLAFATLLGGVLSPGPWRKRLMSFFCVNVLHL